MSRSEQPAPKKTYAGLVSACVVELGIPSLTTEERAALTANVVKFHAANQSLNEAMLRQYITWVLTQAVTAHTRQRETESFVAKTEAILSEPAEKIRYLPNSEIQQAVGVGFDPDAVALKDLPNSVVKTSKIILDSRFRNVSADPRSSRFTMKFTQCLEGEPSAMFMPGVVRVGNALSQQVLSLRLVGASIPNIVSPATSAVDLPYILLDIEETKPNELFTSLTSSHAYFGSIRVDMNKELDVTFRSMTNIDGVGRRWSTKQPGVLPKLTVSLADPNGRELNFDTDMFTIRAFDVLDTSYVSGATYITKTLLLTTVEVIDMSISGESITFCQFPAAQAYEDVGTPGTFYYTDETFDNPINSYTFNLQVVGPYTFTIEFQEGLRSLTTFPGNPALDVNTYGIGKGSGGYVTINARQVSLMFEMTGMI